jgi:hypothetical protein
MREALEQQLCSGLFVPRLYKAKSSNKNGICFYIIDELLINDDYKKGHKT